MAQALVHMSCGRLRSAITTGGDATGGLQKILAALVAIQPLLEDAERKSVRIAVVEHPGEPGKQQETYMSFDRIGKGLVWAWLKRVTNVAYDIIDMVNELEDTRPRDSGKVKRMLPCHRNATKKQAMEKMTEELKEIKRISEDLGLDTPVSSSFEFVEHPGVEELPMEIVQGLAPEQNRIMAACDNTSEGPVILHIYGREWLGMTALAAIIFHDNRFRGHSRAWVHAPPTWQEDYLHKIGESILSQLSGEEEDMGHHGSSDGGMDYITDRLVQLFDDNKVLVVLDSLYLKEEDTHQFNCMFGVGNKRCKVVVIVTSYSHTLSYRDRTIHVADRIEYPNRCADAMCWAMIMQRSGVEDRSEQDKQVLQKIHQLIQELFDRGIWLAAAATLGGMLRYKDAAGWEEVRDDINATYHSGASFRPEELTDTAGFLRVTYRSMSPTLRLCFAYCGIFPSGHIIAKADLIHQWISLGFLEPSVGLSATQLGERQIRMLLGMSLLQTAYRAPTRGRDKSSMLFTMPDEVHEFARSLIVQELIETGKTPNQNEEESSMGSCQNGKGHYALISELDVKQLHDKIRMLLYVGCRKYDELSDSFPFPKSMCVMVLKDCNMKKLPESICQLRHLGYLDLSGCSRLVTLPDSFGKVLSLKHIALSGCSGLGKLPETFVKLINLVHVNLSGCSSLEILPKSFGKLINLVHIKLPGCSRLAILPKSFGKLINLVHINLSGCSGLLNLPETCAKLINLEHIDLSGCSGLLNLPQSFGNLTKLLSVDLSGCHGLTELPESFGKLTNLKDLNLSFLPCLKGIERALGGLTSLERLNLSHPCCSPAQPQIQMYVNGLKVVLKKLIGLQYLNLSMFLNPIFYSHQEKEICDFIECIGRIFSLKHLDLSHNMYLRDLHESLCLLDSLHTLDLSGCIRLMSIPNGIGGMKSLKSLIARNCNCLKSHQLEVKVVNSSSNLVLLEDADFQDLKISCLEVVKSTEEAQRIYLKEKQKLQKLTLCWTRRSAPPRNLEDNALLEKLVPPQSLQYLELNGYRGELYHMAGWTASSCSHLLNLTEVTMVDVETCSTLPPLGVLPSLQRLVLRRMSSLTRIDAHDLNITSRSQWLSSFTLDDLPSLQEFNTRYFGAAGEVLMFPAVDQLRIQECRWLRFVPVPPSVRRFEISRNRSVMICRQTAIGNMSSVTQLVVESTLAIVDDWHLLHCLPGLRSLTIKDCKNVTCSPEASWALSSLQKLCFDHCDLISLPEHFAFLASLQELQIVSCYNFNSLPKWLGDLTSLQKLEIGDCAGLCFLPQSIARLTNLKDLHIWECTRLKNWLGSQDNMKIFSHIRPKFEKPADSASKPEEHPNKSGQSHSQRPSSTGDNNHSNNPNENRDTGGNTGGGPCKLCSGILSFLEYEQRFESCFKMKRETFNYIYKLADYSEKRVRINPRILKKIMDRYTFHDGRVLCSADRVAIALKMLISGGPLEEVASQVGTSESTVLEVTRHFVKAMGKTAISQWPDSVRMEKIKSKFELIHGLPNCCGAVDTTFITNMCPPSAEPNSKLNQNSNLLLQVVVEPDTRFTDWCIGPSVNDDQSIFLLNTRLFKACEKGQKLKVSDGAEVGEYLIGDVGYPLLPWLLTSFKENDFSDRKIEFNRRHSQARGVPLRSLARLKDTWKCLHRELWSPDNSLQLAWLINVCCILHNIVIDMEGAATEEDYVPNNPDANYTLPGHDDDDANENAVKVRDALSQYLAPRSWNVRGGQLEAHGRKADAGNTVPRDHPRHGT